MDYYFMVSILANKKNDVLFEKSENDSAFKAKKAVEQRIESRFSGIEEMDTKSITKEKFEAGREKIANEMKYRILGENVKKYGIAIKNNDFKAFEDTAEIFSAIRTLKTATDFLLEKLNATEAEKFEHENNVAKIEATATEAEKSAKIEAENNRYKIALEALKTATTATEATTEETTATTATEALKTEATATTEVKTATATAKTAPAKFLGKKA